MRFLLIFLLTLNGSFANDQKAEIENLVQNALNNAKDFEKPEYKISYPVNENVNFNSKNEAQILVFVSFRMPKNLLFEYIEEAKRYNATLVLRGFIKDEKGKFSIPATAKKLQEISNKTGVNFIIHPQLFDIFEVSRVPVIIKVNSYFECTQNGGECFEKPQFDKITGSVSIEYALNEFNNI